MLVALLSISFSPSLTYSRIDVQLASFRITIDPSTVNLTAGDEIDVTITVTKISRWSRNSVNLYALNLPRNVSISFTPASGRPTFKSIAKIRTGTQCEAGDFSVTIVASSKYQRATATITLHITTSVKTIGVAAYWDSGCTDEVMAIDWGAIEPGSTKDVTIYLKNEGDVDATPLLSTTNWSPSTASSHISLDWDYSGEQISASGKVQVTLTLTVSPNISGITSFSFDIIIAGTE